MCILHIRLFGGKMINEDVEKYDRRIHITLKKSQHETLVLAMEKIGSSSMSDFIRQSSLQRAIEVLSK